MPALQDVWPRTPGRSQKLTPSTDGPTPHPLCPRERPQTKVVSPAGERLGDPVHEEEIGRSGEHVPSGPARPVQIHRRLHREQQVGRPLDLVEHQLLAAQENRQRVLAGLIADQRIVQSNVGVASQRGVRPDECALPCLPSAGDHHDRHHVKGVGDDSSRSSRQLPALRIFHDVKDYHTSREQPEHA